MDQRQVGIFNPLNITACIKKVRMRHLLQVQTERDPLFQGGFKIEVFLIMSMLLFRKPGEWWVGQTRAEEKAECHCRSSCYGEPSILEIEEGMCGMNPVQGGRCKRFLVQYLPCKHVIYQVVKLQICSICSSSASIKCLCYF
jgi:hypothetical protein